MQIAAGLMSLWVAYCWVLFVRKRYEPLLLLPMGLFTILAIISIIQVAIYAGQLRHPGAQLWGVFIMTALMTGAALKPSRNFFWLVIALTTYRIVGAVPALKADPSALPIVYLAIETLGAASLFYIVQFRPAVFEVRSEDVKSVFD